MQSSSPFIERFRRITYSGRYMPEIDGLRFISIFLVVWVIHLGTYVYAHSLKPGGVDERLYQFFLEGGYGVSIFFIISGFILSVPFAEQKLFGQKAVNIKEYFWRRITRLEPAYIISLVIYFAIRVWVLHYESFTQLLPNFVASFFYVHTIVFDSYSAINGVAWTLEIEVQFYILAPLLSYLFLIKNTQLRRGILVLLVIGSTLFSYSQQYQLGNILNKGCYFLCGMLLADLYLLRTKEYNERIYTIIGIACFTLSIFIPAYYFSIYFCVLKIILVAVFFFFAITNATLKKWLSYPLITAIGGMCYSIYLVHMGILGLLRHKFADIVFVKNIWLNAFVHYIIASIIILIVSAIFFLLIEKPTMKRDWYKKLIPKKH